MHLELRLVPGGAQPHLEPAAGEVVDRHRDLREQTRVTVQIPGHVQTDARACGVLRDGAEDGPAVEDRLCRIVAERDEMIERPEVIEPGCIGDAPGLALGVDRMDLLRKLDADAKRMGHASSVATGTAGRFARSARVCCAIRWKPPASSGPSRRWATRPARRARRPATGREPGPGRAPRPARS